MKITMLFGETLCQHGFNVNFCAKLIGLVEIFCGSAGSISRLMWVIAPCPVHLSYLAKIVVNRSSENGEIEGGVGCHRGPKRSREETADCKDRSNASHERDR